MSYELNRRLRHINLMLSNVLKELDETDLPVDGPIGEPINKAYQSLFAAGDCINEARHHIITNYAKEPK